MVADSKMDTRGVRRTLRSGDPMGDDENKAIDVQEENKVEEQKQSPDEKKYDQQQEPNQEGDDDLQWLEQRLRTIRLADFRAVVEAAAHQDDVTIDIDKECTILKDNYN